MLVGINYGHSIDIDRVHNNNIKCSTYRWVDIQTFLLSNVRPFIEQKYVSVCNIWIGLILQISEKKFRMGNPESVKAQEWNHCKYEKKT